MSFLSDAMERLKALLFRGRRNGDGRRAALPRGPGDGGADPERRRARSRPGEKRCSPSAAWSSTRKRCATPGGIRPLEDLATDIRYALRGLRRSPGFALTAILVLGLGLGATTAVFSIMYSVVLAKLPYPDPDCLVMVAEKTPHQHLEHLHRGCHRHSRPAAELRGLGRSQPHGRRALGPGSPEHIMVGRGSAGFKAVGIPVARGRSIEIRDEDRSRFGAGPFPHPGGARHGRRGAGPRPIVTVDGMPHEVIGVLPPGKERAGRGDATAWTALKLPAPVRRPFWMRGMGRLKEGVTIEMAAADLAGISARILPLWSDFRDSVAKLTPIPLRERIVGRADRQVGSLPARCFWCCCSRSPTSQRWCWCGPRPGSRRWRCG